LSLQGSLVKVAAVCRNFNSHFSAAFKAGMRWQSFANLQCQKLKLAQFQPKKADQLAFALSGSRRFDQPAFALFGSRRFDQPAFAFSGSRRFRSISAKIGRPAAGAAKEEKDEERYQVPSEMARPTMKQTEPAAIQTRKEISQGKRQVSNLH
jgi:hypothetical protein